MTTKTCNCCKRIWTATEWFALPILGGKVKVSCGYELDMRNCSCGSTLCVERKVR